jgi:hypothetical protein
MPGIRISIAFDSTWLDGLKARLDPRQIPQAITAAENKTAAKVKTFLIAAAAKAMNLDKDDIRDSIRIKKATYSTLAAAVIVDRHPVPLSKYPVKQTATGVMATPFTGVAGDIRPGQRPYSFLATMDSGHKGVFVRFGSMVNPTKGVYAGKIVTRGPKKGQIVQRQRIRQLYGPTIAGTLATQPEIKEQLDKFVTDDLPKQIESQVLRFLSKKPVEED